MKENLNSTHDAAGNSTNRLCYNNDTANCTTYGGLYNWYTIMNGATSSNTAPSGVQGICPTGWHVPSEMEWDTLVSSLGGSTVAGGKMKEAGFAHWQSPNTNASNSSEFSALPGGYYYSGSYGDLTNIGHWWSSTQGSSTGARIRNLSNYSGSVYQDNYYKSVNIAVRCVADTFLVPAIDIGYLAVDVNCYGMSDGSIGITVTGGMPPFNYAWSNGETTEDLSNIGAGNYGFTVTDAQGSSADTTIMISEPVSIVLNLNASNYNGYGISCNGANDGSVNISVSGGTSPYDYSWSTGETISAINSLGAGLYFVSVTDTVGCVVVDSVLLIEPEAISLNVNASNYNGYGIACNGAIDGSINISVSGGTSAFSYSWSTGETTNSINSLGAGLYSVLVTDTNGCVVVDSVLLVEPPVITVLATTLDQIGTSTPNGEINLTVSGGNSPYNFSWSNGATSEDLENLNAGNYDVTIEDINGCIQLDSFSIYNTACLLLPYTETFDSSNMPLGWSQQTLGTDGGWLLGDSTGLSSQYFPIPEYGNFIATNDDDCNCDKSADWLISPCIDLSGSNSPVLSFDCYFGKKTYQTSTESATLNVSIDNGTTWIEVDSLSGSDEWRTEIYDLSVYSSNGDVKIGIKYNDGGGWLYGCAIDNFTVKDLLFLDAVITNASCITGTISLITLNGLSPYTYLWSNGGTTQNLQNLQAGTYTVTVTDANGTNGVGEYTVSDDNLTISYNTIGVNSGGSNGGISTSISGGTPPYSVIWSTGDTSMVLENLSIGLYIISVTDANNCSISDSVQISQQVYATRLPLVEHFSTGSSSCGPCCLYEQGFQDVVLPLMDKCAVIRYPSPWASYIDGYETIDSEERYSYYNVPGIPNATFNGAPPLHSDSINNNLIIDSYYNDTTSISINSWYHVSGAEVSINIELQSESAIANTDMVLQVAIVENETFNNITCSQVNSNIFVLKKMLPDANGTVVSSLQPGIVNSYSFSYIFPAGNTVEEFTDLSVVVFVQDNSTHEIYQSAWSTLVSSSPTADFTANTTSGFVPLEVEFTDLSTDLPNNWQWDFGDGTTSTDQNPVHLYQSVGTYTVSLVASNIMGSDTVIYQNYVDVIDALITTPHCLSFDGTDDYVEILASPTLNLQDSFTISMWINPSDWGSVGNSGYGTFFSTENIKMYIHNNGFPSYNTHSLVIALAMENGSSININTNSYSISLDSWQHIAFTYSDGNPIVFINGIETGLSFLYNTLPIGNISNNTNSSLIFGNRTDINRYYEGQIDEAKIWNAVLFQSDIESQMCGTIGYTDLLAYWPFDDGDTSMVLSETSGNLLEGTLINFNFSDSLSSWNPKECSSIAARDIGITRIVNPISNYADILEPGMQTIEVIVKNYGSDTISEAVTLYHQINTGAIVNETIQLSLPPLSFYSHSFSQQIDVSNPGTYNLLVGLSLNQDENTSNDSLFANIVTNEITRPAFTHSNIDKFLMFDLNNPEVAFTIGELPSNDYLTAGTWVNNAWYGITNSNLLLKISHYDATIDTIGNTVPGISGMAYDYSSNALFGITPNGTLYDIDIETGSATYVGSSNYNGSFVNLACDLNGILYSVSLTNDNLYQISPSYSNNSVGIGPIGFNAHYAQDMEFDHNTGVLVMAAYNLDSGSGEIRLVDTATGNTSLLASGLNEYYGFAIPYYPDSLIAYFISDSQSGTFPHTVQFSDASQGYPDNWHWDFGDGITSTDQNPVHIYQAIGSYTVSLVASNLLGIDTVMYQSYIQVLDTSVTITSPSWTYNNTGNAHTILIQGAIPVIIDSTQIAIGDYIGVFYDSLGAEVCAGYEQWTGQVLAVNTWGDDAQTTEPDGFASGELFKWKIWRASDNMVFDATASYMQPPAMPNTNAFATNGMSGLLSLEAYTVNYQIIDLPQGWSYFSTYIDPFEPNIDSLCLPIVNEVFIVKSGAGQTYWPQWNINMLGEIEIGQGYQIKMNSTQTMEVAGLAVAPENTPVILVAGWSIIGYLRQSPAPIDQLLGSVVSEIVIAKNGMGQTYWPLWGINMIGNMMTGEGYQIKMNSQQTITYPANSILYSKHQILVSVPVHFLIQKNTGNNMSLGVISKDIDRGIEIGLFSQSGLLIGASVVTSDFTSITLWGDDETTPEIDGLQEGEEFFLKQWNGEESAITVGTWLEGSNGFENNKIAIAKLAAQGIELRNCELFQNTPNPFNGETEFSFYLSESTKATLSILNVVGETIEVLAEDEFEKGKHLFMYQSKNLTAGTYYYRLVTPNFIGTKKMVIVK